MFGGRHDVGVVVHDKCMYPVMYIEDILVLDRTLLLTCVLFVKEVREGVGRD